VSANGILTQTHVSGEYLQSVKMYL